MQTKGMSTGRASRSRSQGQATVDGSGDTNVHHGWKARLDAFIRGHVQFKQAGEGQRTSLCTQRNVTVGLFRLFRVLRQGGFKIENPRNLQTKHIRYLLDWMEQRHEDGRLQSSTIQGYVSYLRILCGWIGRPQLLEEAGGFKDPTVGQRSQVAKVDKSWEGQGIDIGERIEAAWDIEPWVAMALLAQAAFGLRRKEAVCLIPACDYAEDVGLLFITRGTKGGRARSIPLHTQWQYEVMALLIEFCRRGSRRNSHIGGLLGDLKSNLRRYSYVVGDKLGITGDVAGTTGHGLRAGFACRLLEAHGITPPVRGGAVSEADPRIRQEAYRATTESLGHSRASVVSVYAGSVRAPGDVQHPITMDDARIDPPNMARLIENLRLRSRQSQAEHRLMRKVAKDLGRRAPAAVPM